MRTKKYCTLIFIVVLFTLLTACNPSKQKNTFNKNVTQAKNIYAKGFSIANAADYTVVTVYNPWRKGAIYAKYYLVKDSTLSVPSDGSKVLIPIKRLIANSATYFEPLSELHSLSVVKGTCNAKFIYSPFVLSDIKSGKIQDLGDSFNLNFEKLISLHPDAVMTTTYNADDANIKRLKQTGIPILYNFEWMETSPLARAEWIRFIGAFVDRQAQADKIFKELDKNYQDAKALVANVKEIPTVMVGQDFRGSWSVPGGRSFNAQLIADAKGRYFYANDTTSGSISITVEQALVNFGSAQIWIAAQTNTLQELQATNSRYALFQAFRNKKVYNWNARMTGKGGNDYWESGVARPDLILKDLIKTFHPELLLGYKPIYLSILK
jgi:iron complex transport system substrate-binding protein